MPEQNSKKLNDIFDKIELFLVRFAVFVIFLIGLYRVVIDTLSLPWPAGALLWRAGKARAFCKVILHDVQRAGRTVPENYSSRCFRISAMSHRRSSAATFGK